MNPPVPPPPVPPPAVPQPAVPQPGSPADPPQLFPGKRPPRGLLLALAVVAVVAGIVTGIVAYFQHAEVGWAIGGLFLGVPAGALGGGLVGAGIGGHRRKADLGPLPLLVYGSGAGVLRRRFLNQEPADQPPQADRH